MKILYKKTNFKKVGFSTMAFTAKILSWRFRHLDIVGCLLKRRPTKGEVTATPGHPPPSPSYAPVFMLVLLLLLLLCRSMKLWNADHIMSSIGRIA